MQLMLCPAGDESGLEGSHRGRDLVVWTARDDVQGFDGGACNEVPVELGVRAWPHQRQVQISRKHVSPESLMLAKGLEFVNR